MLTDWSVGRLTGVCSLSGTAFLPEQDVMAAIYELPGDAGFTRRDFSLPAWEQSLGRVPLADGQPMAEPFSFWRTRVRVREEKQRLLVDDDSLIQFFERLADETEPVKLQFRYVLALILLRKRILRLESEQPATAQDYPLWNMTLSLPGAAEGMPRRRVASRVSVPPIREDQIATISEQLTAILASEA